MNETLEIVWGQLHGFYRMLSSDFSDHIFSKCDHEEMQTYKTGYGFCWSFVNMGQQFCSSVLFFDFGTSVRKLEDHEQALCLFMF